MAMIHIPSRFVASAKERVFRKTCRRQAQFEKRVDGLTEDRMLRHSGVCELHSSFYAGGSEDARKDAPRQVGT